MANESDWGYPFAIDPCRSLSGAGDDAWIVDGDVGSVPLAFVCTPFVLVPVDEDCDPGTWVCDAL